MGYDLNFWAYADETVPRGSGDHLAVYRALCEGQRPEGLSDLPFEAIRSALPGALPDWSPAGATGFERDGAAIDARVQPFWVRFDLYGKWTGADTNALIDLMKSFGCPLFDPQAGTDGKRFSPA